MLSEKNATLLEGIQKNVWIKLLQPKPKAIGKPKIYFNKTIPNFIMSWQSVSLPFKFIFCTLLCI